MVLILELRSFVVIEENTCFERKSPMSLRMLVEAGMAIAIAFVLHLVVLFHMPQGGSITAAHMVPLLIFAYRWGGKYGMLVGAVYGLVQFLLGFKFTIHIASIFLDYGLAYAMIGLAGFFKDSMKGLVAGTFTAFLGRFVVSVISGAVIFGSYAPEGTNPWIYSALYNMSYMIPDFAVNLAGLLFIYRGVKKGLSKSSR